MSEIFHIVPWISSEEWHTVYKDLSNASSSKGTALNFLIVWKARCPSLPSGIESTLTLLQVYVEDTNKTIDATNDQFIRLAYSSAVMRFVNHMLDAQTAKGSSLYQAAKSVGVPEWIVDLRHDTAHSHNLPPLTLLREACKFSLQWLLSNYWDKHKPLVQDYLSGQKYLNNNDENKIAALINFCTYLSICGHSNCNIKKLSQIPNPSMQESIVNDAKELFNDLIDLSNLKTVSVQSLITMMNTQANTILCVKDVNSHVSDALLGSDSVLLSKELLHFFSGNSLKKNKLNSSYVQCFEVLLTFLHSKDLLLSLITSLIQITQNEQSDQFKARLASLWVSEILMALKRSKLMMEKIKMSSNMNVKSKKKDLKRLYNHWFPNSTGNQLLLDVQKPIPLELLDINYIQPFITAYNPYLTFFIRDLLDLIEPSLPVEVADRICMLAKLISAPEKFPVSSSSTIYTAEDIKFLNQEEDIEIIETAHSEDIDMKEALKKAIGIEGNSIWRLASKEHNWASCPIGQVPWLKK